MTAADDIAPGFYDGPGRKATRRQGFEVTGSGWEFLRYRHASRSEPGNPRGNPGRKGIPGLFQRRGFFSSLSLQPLRVMVQFRVQSGQQVVGIRGVGREQFGIFFLGEGKEIVPMVLADSQ